MLEMTKQNRDVKKIRRSAVLIVPNIEKLAPLAGSFLLQVYFLENVIIFIATGKTPKEREYKI